MPEAGSGQFSGFVTEGEYEIAAGAVRRKMTLLPGGSYHVDLRPGRHVDVRVTAESRAGGAVALKVSALGSGSHVLSVRTSNLALDAKERRLDLQPGVASTFTWEGKMEDANAPWIAVVIPDGDVSQKQEAAGHIRAVTMPAAKR